MANLIDIENVGRQLKEVEASLPGQGAVGTKGEAGVKGWTKGEGGIATSAGGSKSSHIVPNYFQVPPGLDDPIALRFMYGNVKYEACNTVYSEANWYASYRNRDVAYFRERGAHAIKHIKREMRGDTDHNPGGNIGGAGWFLSILAFIQNADPFFYGAIQGLWRVDDKDREKNFPPPVYYA